MISTNAFNLDKYLKLQSENILKRVEMFDNKLYLEFGGKLFDDYHASRVLPGFVPDAKLKMLLQIKEYVEIVIAISAEFIESGKIRKDLNITYESDVFRLIDAFREIGLYVGSVVITKYRDTKNVKQFETKLKNLGIKSYKHYFIESYPQNVEHVLSEDGFGKNDYIETTKPVVVVTAPGPCSGKMATCLSQLYHEAKRGVKAGYAKYETFPIWNLPLNNPVNLAYEAATIDLNDVNMIDPYHFEAYGITTVNYNRDVEVFPVLRSMFERIYGTSPYKSPTDMGVNMIGFCIDDLDSVEGASKREIVRRYCDALIQVRNGILDVNCLYKMKNIMSNAEVTPENRKVIKASLEKEEATGVPAAALELPDKQIITAKNSKLFTCTAGCIFNALKIVSGIDDKLDLIPSNLVKQIILLKVDKLGNHNPRLHVDEALIALAISAETNPVAELAFSNLEKLHGSEMHVTTIIPREDENAIKKLKINVTCEPKNQPKNIIKINKGE